MKTCNGAQELDSASLQRAHRLVGLNGYVTNIDAALMPAAEISASYHDLWHVEQSFRMSKSDIAGRPIFARNRDAIETHLTIVFTALAVSREVQAGTGLSVRRFLPTLKTLRSATIDINSVIATFAPEVTSRPRPFSTRYEPKTQGTKPNDPTRVGVRRVKTVGRTGLSSASARRQVGSRSGYRVASSRR